MLHKEHWLAGHHVFGLHGVDESGHCECGNPECKAFFKHPRISRWSLAPHWSEEQFLTMCESGQFATGYGVLCKNLLVIDIDARNGGMEAFTKLSEVIPEIASAGYIVTTGSGAGSRHMYYALPDNTPLVSSLPEYEGIDFKSSGFVVGAGSMHKSGNTYQAVIGSPSDIEPAPKALIELLTRKEHIRVEHSGRTIDCANQDILDMLACINPDCGYEEWIRVGMALHHGTQGAGFAFWLNWSKEGRKFRGIEDLENHWQSFGKSAHCVTVGTLVHYAEAGGYIAPVTFDDDPPEEAPTDGLPVPIDDVDVLRPPGLAGRITDWINARCLYPREHLAVIGALTTIGNLAGLRYTDDKDGVSLNLLSLCVSASATGKETILQAVILLHEVAKTQGAVSGNIKSEQEIVRNLIRHQAAFYIIDELGYLLQKIESARQKGGAAYLDGVISTIMAVYSKADGSFLISGDLKASVATELGKELAQCRKKIEDGEDKSGYYARKAEQIAEYGLKQIELGLARPYLSLFGMTTPVSFDGLVNVEQSTNGFIGRCILVREPETNPKRKRGWRKPERNVPMEIAIPLCALYGQTESDRVEYHGERTRIRTTDQAMDTLENIADYLEDLAETHKGKTGLEAIIRRSYELISKVSTILAVSEGVRTEDHVRWAFAYVLKDIETKLRLAQANIQEGTQEALESRIMDACGEGEPMSVITRRVGRKYREADIKKAVDSMTSRGLLVNFCTNDDSKGRKGERWRVA